MTLIRLIGTVVLALFVAQSAQAHRFAPSLLKVTETGSDAYNVVWKTPAQGTSSIPLRPVWPDSCEVYSSSSASSSLLVEDSALSLLLPIA